MARRLLARVPLLTTVLFLIAACDSGGGGAPTPEVPLVPQTQSIVVTPSLGQFSGGFAQAFAANGNALSDMTAIGDGGTAPVTIPASHTGPVIVQVTGSDTATYYDESSQQQVPITGTRRIRASLSAPRASAGVSILTELATLLAEASGDELDAAAIDAANEQIRAALAPDVSDLLTPPTLVNASTGAGAVDGSDAGKLAARLGALAMLAAGDATPALTILEQLSLDVADGDIDGSGSDGAIEGLAYDAANFAAAFVAAIRDFAAAFGDASLQDAAGDAVANTDIGGGGAPAGACGSDAGAVMEGAVGLGFVTNCAGSYTVTMTNAGTHESKTVVIDADGNVTFDGEIMFAAGDIVAIFDRIAVDRRIQINYGADDDGDVILIFLNEALDAVERIVYRNRTAGIETDVTVSDAEDAVPEGGAGGGGLDPDGDGINGTTAPGTVNADLVMTVTLTYADRSPDNDNDPFMDGQEVQGEITADGRLILDDMIFENPFNRSLSLDGSPHLPEIIWYDATNDLEYALSDNERGSFNEINVGDASMPQGQFGLPAFLGQLRGPEPAADTGATTIAMFAGAFDAQVINSCSGSLCDGLGTPAGDTVSFSVDGNGVIRFGTLTLDPATDGAQFTDSRQGSTQPRLTLQVPVSMDETLTADLYIDESSQPPQGQPIRAVAIRRTVGASGSSILAEQPELRTLYTDFFNTFVTRTTPPVRMVIVQDDETFNGKSGNLSTAPFGVSSLCRAYELQGVQGPTDAPGALTTFRPQFAFVSGDTRVEAYDQRSARLTTNGVGESQLNIDGAQFVLGADGHVRLEEGTSVAENTSLIRVETVRDSATSQQTAIDAACADFVSFGGMVSYSQAGQVTVTIIDTGGMTEQTIYERVFSFTAAGSVPYEELLPRDLQYRVEATAFGASSPTCMVTNATGTLVAPVGDVDVDCAPAP